MIRKDQHMTPMVPSSILKENRIKVLETFFADALEICGFCGYWKHRQHDCGNCNHVITYAEEFDEKGYPIELWTEKK